MSTFYYIRQLIIEIVEIIESEILEYISLHHMCPTDTHPIYTERMNLCVCLLQSPSSHVPPQIPIYTYLCVLSPWGLSTESPTITQPQPLNILHDIHTSYIHTNIHTCIIHRYSDGTILVATVSIPSNYLAVSKGHTRATLMSSTCLIEPDLHNTDNANRDGCIMTFVTHAKLGGSVPKWIISMLGPQNSQKSLCAARDLLEKDERENKDYKKYL